MDAIDKAIGRLTDWALRSEWAPLLSQVYTNHVGSIAETIEGGEDKLKELLGDSAGMLRAFVIEDFFTARFGQRGELNVVDDYLEQDGRRESATERRYLESLRDSIPSLYEVVDIDPGRSLTVRDLLLPGEAMTVLDQRGSQGAAPWDRLAARIVVVNGERQFTGSVLRLRHQPAGVLLRAFEETLKKATKGSGRKVRRWSTKVARRSRKRRQKEPPMDREAIVRGLSQARIFSRAWLADVVARGETLEDLRNSDLEPIAMCDVRFPIIGDEADISSALDGIETFERVEHDEGHWAWLAPYSRSHRASRSGNGNPVFEVQDNHGNVSLGRAVVESGTVSLRVNSRERAARGQALLSSRLGHLVGQAVVSAQEPNEFLKTDPEQSTPDHVEPPSEQEVQASHEWLDSHYRRTLDEPLPILGGRTLRQVSKTEKGRAEAIAWLKQVENLEHHKAANSGQRVYETRWMWQELGIERVR